MLGASAIPEVFWEPKVTDTQLYLAIGLPVFAILMSMIAGILRHNAIGARFTSMENRFLGLEARFETLIGKVIAIDNRLTRIEAVLERH